MKENEYDKAIEEMLKEMRIKLDSKDSGLLIDENDVYLQPSVDLIISSV